MDAETFEHCFDQNCRKLSSLCEGEPIFVHAFVKPRVGEGLCPSRLPPSAREVSALCADGGRDTPRSGVIASQCSHWRGNPFPRPTPWVGFSKGEGLCPSRLLPSVREVSPAGRRRERRNTQFSLPQSALRAASPLPEGARKSHLPLNVKLHNFKAIKFLSVGELSC